MNQFSIGAQAVAGGYIAWFRRVHKADNEILLGKGGQPIIYATKAEAKAAAGERLCAYINGSLVRDGEKLQARSEADAVFNLKPFVKQRGKSRRIQVERKGGAA
ncbi:hypothetical protein [Gellertiella hungarica]|uniref:Uncharacterized protein n=1 Tax=Gellertiella hungarica TaxID=1572859 RepID=A0A7W6J4F4_9HYPH|nr:hypothetical protein [Gellertiella hungarica]MBB4063663.1 hypothetical protein [Gellertiella hungarica]